ncbi:hypothetical protein D3C78_1182250 [compost metagenome]
MLRVVGQDTDGVVAHEQLAADHRAHAASELAMPQMQPIDPVEATETMFPLGDFDIVRTWLEDFRHPAQLADQ